MGYTHYWKYNISAEKNFEALRKKFRKAVISISDAYNKIAVPREITLCGGLGEGNPVIQETCLWFNGDGFNGLDHETFHVDLFTSKDFNFCKTARKPYDIMVGLSLLFLTANLGNKVFSYSSDGGEADWVDCYEAYQQLTGGKTPPAPRI